MEYLTEIQKILDGSEKEAKEFYDFCQKTLPYTMQDVPYATFLIIFREGWLRNELAAVKRKEEAKKGLDNQAKK